ncbi:MAG: GDP-mannose pyrophosphatase NudK [Marinoscillum sp.]
MENGRIKNLKRTLLSDNWYKLEKLTFDYLGNDGKWETQQREAYDRGNGAVILLYNKEKKTIILTRQFRVPTYINGNPDGLMIEACAGLLEANNPEDCIRKETEEETGYSISKVDRVFEVYMSPGSVTEILYFFLGEYQPRMKVSEGGGAEDESENIEVLELDFEESLRMIESGEIKDAKTIMLIYHMRVKGLL